MHIRDFYFSPDESSGGVAAPESAPAPEASSAPPATTPVATSTAQAVAPAPTRQEMAGASQKEYEIPLAPPRGIPPPKRPAPTPVEAVAEPEKPAETAPPEKAPEVQAAPVAAAEAAPAATLTDKPVETPAGSSEPTSIVLTPEQEALQLLAASQGITETDPVKIKEIFAQREEQAVQAREAEYQRKVNERVQQAGDQAVARLLHPRVVQELRASDTEGLYASVDFNVPGWEKTQLGMEAAKEYLAIQREFMGEPETQRIAQLERESAQKSIADEAAKVQSFKDTYPSADFELLQNLHAHGADMPLIEEIGKRMEQAVRKNTAMLNSAVATKDAEIERLSAQIAGHADAMEKAVADAFAEGEQSALETINAGRELKTTIGVGAAVSGAGSRRPVDSPLTYRPSVPMPTR